LAKEKKKKGTKVGECPVCHQMFECTVDTIKHIMREHRKAIPPKMTVYEFYDKARMNNLYKDKRTKEEEEKIKEKERKEAKVIIKEEVSETTKKNRKSSAIVYTMAGKKVKIFEMIITTKDIDALLESISVIDENTLVGNYDYDEKSFQNGRMFTVPAPEKDRIFCIDKETKSCFFDKSIFIRNDNGVFTIEGKVVIITTRIAPFIEHMMDKHFEIKFKTMDSYDSIG
jgi:hypothetical protein